MSEDTKHAYYQQVSAYGYGSGAAEWARLIGSVRFPFSWFGVAP
jgi:hypothetical protein